METSGSLVRKKRITIYHFDVQVERKREKLMTIVFRKKTYTNRVLAFDSHRSNNSKRAVIISLFDKLKSHFGKK